jgi:prepilin-type N-terminal cleavage/methylation domain-containing protein
MSQRKGFTLVELLVVIAIIALLMSILMPALARVRNQAKAVLCLSNLKQWALVFSLYTGDNDGYFMNGMVPRSSEYWWAGGNGGGMGSWWFIPLRPYYRDDDLRFCPTATKPYEEGSQPPFGAWRTWLGDTGSYGANGYIINSPDGLDMQLGRATMYNWRTCNVRGASYIPVFLDSLWVDAWPVNGDEPPPFDFWLADTINSNEMRRFCVNRHDRHVNGVFMDFSTVRKIGLKELWRLKWHRRYDVNGEPPVMWDEPSHLMYRFKDYD